MDMGVPTDSLRQAKNNRRMVRTELLDRAVERTHRATTTEVQIRVS